ncbi:MAG: MmgE/PrpD family protein [Gammaproteobacteria bacterium]|nr:MmgE/PrpD family protein [Gammaproteobacteria bacterium]
MPLSDRISALDAPPLAVAMARALRAVTLEDLPVAVIDKVKICLFDFVGCAFESHALPWSRQARALTERLADEALGASIIGTPGRVSAADAAFANAVMGHGLVREDMHSGSISHLGIVVLPTLLALAPRRRVSGREFILAAVAGYEAGAKLGRAVMDAEVAKIHRPTGVTGPTAGAAAGARLLGLDEGETTTALALAANTTLGLNQWAHTGGSEMFFQAGIAARNAVLAVRLAESGAFASPSALDGKAGLFAAFGKRATARIALFAGAPEILAVYHKPVPACNFAQTASQAALRLSHEAGFAVDDIETIAVRVPRAGMLYPGCNHRGPFAHVLQAKMSIQYNVAAALLERGVTEHNFALLEDPRLHRLIAAMTLEVDDAMSRVYPGLQGGEVALGLRDGSSRRLRLDDVVNATPDEVRARFRGAVAAAIGAPRAEVVENTIAHLEDSDDVAQLGALLAGAS